MVSQRIFRGKRWWVVLAALVLWLGHACYHHKGLGFSLEKITSDFPPRPEWELPPLSQEDAARWYQLLAQPFRYLASGSQAYVFASEDGTAVIKFFRMKHNILHLKDLWRGDRSQERKETLLSVYHAHTLAYRFMREDAALLYVHLNKTQGLYPTPLRLIDLLGRVHEVPLDDVEFVVQERGELLFSRFAALLQKHRWHEFRRGVNGLLDLIRRREVTGLADHDKAVRHNFGFVGDRVVQFDVGRIYLGHGKEEVERVTRRIHKWLQPFIPSLTACASSLPPRPEWSIPPMTPEERARLIPIVQQPFHFLGEGAQAVAFESEDGRYVLKLFKMHRLYPSVIDRFCPHVVRRRLKNLRWVFNGYHSAYQDLRSETGLVWIHLAKTHDIHMPLTLVDPMGNVQILDLDRTECIIQEKCELLFHRLERLYREGRIDAMHRAIHSVEALVAKRMALGYADRDHAVSYNYGFVGDKAIQLDVGRLYRGSQPRQLEHVQKRINRWKELMLAPS